MIRAIFLIIFIAVPIIEIAIFIQVGSLIGLWRTLATIFITAIIGVGLLKRQGLTTLANAQTSLDEGRLPVDSLFHGVALLVAGALLLTPGFLTDAIGFLLLVPAFRLWIGKRIWTGLKQAGGPQRDGPQPDGPYRVPREHLDPHSNGTPGPVIEGEIVDEDTSPWHSGPNKPDDPQK